MAKIWEDKGDGVFEATDTVILERVTREELVNRKTMLQEQIATLQNEISQIDADIASIDAL